MSKPDARKSVSVAPKRHGDVSSASATTATSAVETSSKKVKVGHSVDDGPGLRDSTPQGIKAKKEHLAFRLGGGSPLFFYEWIATLKYALASMPSPGEQKRLEATLKDELSEAVSSLKAKQESVDACIARLEGWLEEYDSKGLSKIPNFALIEDRLARILQYCDKASDKGPSRNYFQQIYGELRPRL